MSYYDCQQAEDDADPVRAGIFRQLTQLWRELQGKAHADHVNQLEQRIRKLESRDMEWTSITESLPTEYMPVLGFDVFYERIHIVSWDGARFNREDDYDDMSIEFWTALPAKPCVNPPDDED
jgi:hypothetical protein